MSPNPTSRQTIAVSDAISDYYTPGLHYVGAMTGGTPALNQERCKHQCYSDIYCNKWITVAGTAADAAKQIAIGCYVGNKASPGTVQDPLSVTKAWAQLTLAEQQGATALGHTATTWDENKKTPAGMKDWAQLIPAEQQGATSLGWTQATWDGTQVPQGQTTVGESIAHTCTPPVTTVSKFGESNLFTVMLITLLICIVLIVGLIIAILLCRKPAEKKSVSRAVKVSPKPKQQALVPMVPMPVMMTQPTVAYASVPLI